MEANNGEKKSLEKTKKIDDFHSPHFLASRGNSNFTFGPNIMD